MAKVEAIIRTKNQRAELMQVYKEEKECDALPNNDETEKDDSGYESENWGESLKNYKDEKHITNKDFEIVLRNIFEENTPWLEKEDILSIIEDDIGDIGLCHKNKFDKSVSFFDHLRKKAQYCPMLKIGRRKTCFF